MKILIIQNIARESPGLIGEILDEKGYDFDICDANENDLPNPSEYGAVFALGGPDSANDQTQKMINEISLIKDIMEAQIPFFGVCLGMQALVKAAGGEVYKNPVKEIGCKDYDGAYYEVHLTQDGKNDKIFTGIKSPFKIFHLHGETVGLKHGMNLLGTGKHCTNQIIKIGSNAYGVQGHLEVTELMLKKWLGEDPMFENFDNKIVMEDFKSIKNEYRKNGMKILSNFLDLAENSEKKTSKIISSMIA